jgi:hypothetical protein
MEEEEEVSEDMKYKTLKGLKFRNFFSAINQCIHYASVSSVLVLS